MSFRGGGRQTQRTILPFGLDYADIISSTQEAEKPQLLLPINGDASEVEQIIAKQAINFSKIMSDGPFFTGNLDSIGGSSDNKNGSASADGIERYSDRYKKVQKIGRTIEEHPYQAQFFPAELYSVMGISNKDKKKILALSKFHSNGGLREFLSNEQIENMDEEAKVKAMQERMLSLANAAEGDEHKEDGAHHSGEEEEDVDDEFEDDDDDDYNAEKYFDDGDDDGGDDGGDDEAAF
ncbi:DNA-directed RNA polymerase III subunit RPC7 [Candida viswanathii]|uniref:DNA-directed RNA polymerase III subunit n=1 Tax=Candida viswanathii TaxID=5486 RepID=A0A367XYY8_9ASCO|nr:DNA-directed RNA polymerase III subunit RPC7 [Candida viswanathii]